MFIGSRFDKIETGNIIVPSHFYKIIVEMGKDTSGIAFVIPNERSLSPLNAYIKSIDYVQGLTKLDFFSSLPDSVELDIETKINISDWK